MSAIDEFSEPTSGYLRTVQETTWLVLSLAERLQQGFAAHAAEFGLSAAQAKVLLRLQSGEDLPMRKLARSLGYDPSNLTGLVDKLEARGAVERRLDPADRRIKAIAMTEEGLRLREDFRGRLVGDAGALASMSDSQIKDLRNLLQMALAQG
ncbi:MAG: MarR family transcriptional regulator [Actinomycetota bacterium]|nr:MarR family transcriptional regulator [Actinomycetota bacterium]